MSDNMLHEIMEEEPETPAEPEPKPEPDKQPGPVPPAAPDAARAHFDAQLAERLSRKNLEIIELRIALARADEARRSYLNILLCVLFMAGWLYLWGSTLRN